MGDAHIAAIAEQFRVWHRTGALPSPARRYRPLGSPAAWLAISLALLLAVATPAGFLWLVAIAPATSGAGVAAQAFVSHLAGGDDDAAYGMLSAGRRAALPREQLRSHLTPELREARGLRVNGVAGGSRTTCIDGHLDGVHGSRSQVAFDVVTEEGAERIDGWRRGPCHRRR